MKSDWLLCLTYLKAGEASARVRQWRAFRAAGAAVLRDGAYLLPAGPEQRRFFATQIEQVRRGGGEAWLLQVVPADEREDATFRALFDRGPAYAAFSAALEQFRSESAAMTLRQRRLGCDRLNRSLKAIEAIDFFPSRRAGQSRSALEAVIGALQPDANAEPRAAMAGVPRRSLKDYQGRVWVTRARLWVDRVACAWLIRRFIDAEAEMLWSRDVRKRPRDSLGFDFDGADFTHVGSRVSFEVLAASFGLEADPGLKRMGGLIRALDLGLPQVPAEGPGLLTLLGGARQTCQDDDDRFLALLTPALDCLYAAYAASGSATSPRSTSRRTSKKKT